MENKSSKSDESKALYVLAFEFRKDEIEANNIKIRKNIGARKIDSYPSDWIDNLRAFKDSVQREIHKSTRSKYYRGNTTGYADISDFKTDELISYYQDQFQNIPAEEINNFIPYAIYLYYMR